MADQITKVEIEEVLADKKLSVERQREILSKMRERVEAQGHSDIETDERRKQQEEDVRLIDAALDSLD